MPQNAGLRLHMTGKPSPRMAQTQPTQPTTSSEPILQGPELPFAMPAMAGLVLALLGTVTGTFDHKIMQALTDMPHKKLHKMWDRQSCGKLGAAGFLLDILESFGTC